jgi:copper chaperone CopZ
MNVKKAVDSVEGVTSSDVSVGSAKVMYDDLKTNKADITKAVQNAGYKVSG